MSREVVQVPFLGSALTGYANLTPVLDVIYFAEFLRDPDGLCAFCHGDPLGERPCTECGGGHIHTIKPGELPIMHLPVRTFNGAGYSFQHIPHRDGCSTVTWIDREYWATPGYSYFETCPCCQGRPS